MPIDVLAYFRSKADRYDDVDDQIYWKLSDALVWEALTGQCLDRLPPAFTFLDAGAGTGRWATRVADAYPRARGVLADVSTDMLRVAKSKLTGEREGRLEVMLADLDDTANLRHVMAGYTFDVIWNFHNVIGFLRNPGQVISTLSTLLAPGGFLVTMAPNRYHAAYFNLAIGRVGQAASAVATGLTTFTDSMPPLRTFGPTEIADLHREAGLQVELLAGLPATIYPGYQETQLAGSSGHLADLLADPTTFEQIFELERALLAETDVAARGNNILVVARKEHGSAGNSQ